jgi:hypothetical protein
MLAAADRIQCQVVRDMKPEQIKEAIAFGVKEKNVTAYRIQEKARFSWPPLIGAYTTPFIRVAIAANAAKRQYRAFTAADVTPEMIAPEVLVYAPSKSLGGAQIANVVTIALLPVGSKDLQQAIHPIRISEAPEQYRNLLGFEAEGRGILAAFPVSVWTEDKEIHIVFDQRIPSSNGGGSLGGCTDCKVKIYLDKVR